MKKLCFTVLLLLLSNVCFAQNADTKAITDTVESLRLAMLNSNKNVLEQIALPSLSYGHSSGRVENKAGFVDSIITGKSVFETLDFSDQSVKIDGNVAIIRHLMEAITHDNGKPGKVKIGVMLVMTKDDSGKWHLLARQAYKLPQ